MQAPAHCAGVAGLSLSCKQLLGLHGNLVLHLPRALTDRTAGFSLLHAGCVGTSVYAY